MTNGNYPQQKWHLHKTAKLPNFFNFHLVSDITNLGQGWIPYSSCKNIGCKSKSVDLNLWFRIAYRKLNCIRCACLFSRFIPYRNVKYSQGLWFCGQKGLWSMLRLGSIYWQIIFGICWSWSVHCSTPGSPKGQGLLPSAVADPGFPVGGGMDLIWGGMDLIRGAMDPRGGYISKILHVKMKESGPIGGRAPGTPPLDPPMIRVM